MMDDKPQPDAAPNLEGLPDNLVFSPNRIHGDEIANKVDRLFREDMWLLTQLLPRILIRLGRGSLEETVEAKRDINFLVLNANTTALAALELWRRGFPLQVGILLRNAVETIATATAINSDMQAYEHYKGGTFKSSKAFIIAKKVWPIIGDQLARVNGALSDDFTHLGHLYRRWQSVSVELNEEDIFALKTMLLPIKLTLHVLDVLSELTCYEFCDDRRYWTRLGPGAYQFAPTSEGQCWMQHFLAERDVQKGVQTDGKRSTDESVSNDKDRS